METETRFDISLRQYWDLLSTYLSQQKRSTLLLAFLLLTGIGLQLLNPQIVRIFLDAAEEQTGLPRLMRAAGLFMAIALMRQVFNLAGTYVGENVAWRATNDLREDLALHCLQLDMSFHKRYKPGELIERVDGDVNQLANFFSQLVVRLGGNLLLVLGVLVLLWMVDWRIGLSMTLLSGVALLALDWLNKRTVPRWRALRQADAVLFGSIEEWLQGTQEIRTSGAEGYILHRLILLLRERWNRLLEAMKINLLVVDFPYVSFALAYAAAHLIGTSIYQSQAVTIGGLYLIFYYIDLMHGPLWEILRQVEELQRATASIDRIAALRQEKPRLHDGPGVVFAPGALDVAFERVRFHYEDDPHTLVLEDISFTLPAGKVLGLLGRTGSGKTTLTKLLLRFHDPVHGAICLGGCGTHFDLRQATLSALRQHVGMVTQEVQLFQASVRDNLTMFDDRVPEVRVRQVLEQIGLGPWLAALPEGLETTLEQSAGGLSAGQAQLLAFARVFLGDPGLVILDEASSRLDPATETQIEHAMDELLQGRTAIIVAHRLRTVQRADDILILEGGRVEEHGSRQALLGDPGSRFAQLMQAGIEEMIV